MSDSEPTVSPDEIEFVAAVPEPLWTFAYVSRPTRRFGDAELRQLHLAAQTWNYRHDLTGRLVVVEKDGEPVRFVQCVEGPRPDLILCWRRIYGDTRHGNIRIVQSREIPARRFAQWSMQYEVMSETDGGLEAVVALWGADAKRFATMGEEILPVDPPMSA